MIESDTRDQVPNSTLGATSDHFSTKDEARSWLISALTTTIKFMKRPQDFKKKPKFVLTDIDDTMTDEGHLGADAYSALWKMHEAGIKVIPVTGRPAGWCEMIARLWPVSGVVGENGGFYFRYHAQKMHRHFVFDETQRALNRKKLNELQEKILKEVPGCALASDQFTRLMDLAIDFCEDVPRLPKSSVTKIVDLFAAAGAHAKVSSIHVNGWFGEYNKLSQSLTMLKNEFGVSAEQAKEQAIFIGDSPNDEPMWEYFPDGFAVANIQNFWNDLKSHPRYVANKPGGQGFAEIAEALLKNF